MSAPPVAGKKLFQSTRPCGARQEMQKLGIDVRAVSIHAPVRGATQIFLRKK